MLRLILLSLSLCVASFVSAQNEIVTAAEETNHSGVLASSTVIPAKKTAKQWLDNLHNLITNNNFEARFVVLRGGQDAVPYLWRHGVMEGGPDMEQLNVQNGPGKEFIRIGTHVSVFESDETAFTVVGNSINGPIPWALLQNEQFLYDSYDFIVVGPSRISGQLAMQLRIVSNDSTRYSYQLWLDEKTGMLLKMNMLDAKGAILEQIQMLVFAVSKEPHPYFSGVNKAKLPRLMSMPSTPPDDHQWKVSYLPTGMKEIKQDTRRLAATGQQVEYRLFSDGLVDISVYVESSAQSLNGDVLLRHGLDTFLSRSIGNTQITVIGEIPPETANAIANSIQSVH